MRHRGQGRRLRSGRERQPSGAPRRGLVPLGTRDLSHHGLRDSGITVGGQGDGRSPRPVRHHGGRGRDRGDRADGVRNGRLHCGGRMCRRVGSNTDRRRPPGVAPAVGRRPGRDRPRGRARGRTPAPGPEPAPALRAPASASPAHLVGTLLAGAAWCTGGRSSAARGTAGCLLLAGGIWALGITRGARGPGALLQPGSRPRDPQGPTRHDGSCSPRTGTGESCAASMPGPTTGAGPHPPGPECGSALRVASCTRPVATDEGRPRAGAADAPPAVLQWPAQPRTLTRPPDRRASGGQPSPGGAVRSG